MHRTPIWDLPWFAIEVLLLGAFDWRELSNLLDSTRTRREKPEEHPVTVIRMAHRAAREKTSFARAVQRLLDFRYRTFLEAVRDSEAETLACTLGATCLGDADRVAGVTWALARDPRPGAEAALECLLARVHGAALWSFLRRPVASEESEAEG